MCIRDRSSWYRPADVVLFVPATPEADLANKAREVVEGEGRRLNIKVKVVKRGGPTMKQHLVRTDMGRSIPCPDGDCPICLTNPGEGGGRSTTDQAPSTLEIAWSARLNMEMTLKQSTGVSLVLSLIHI